MNNDKDDFIDTQNFLPAIEKAIELRHNVAFRGRTGTGKTFLVRQLARKAGKELATLNMTVNTSVDEIKGRYILTPAPSGAGMNAKWIDGSITRMMRTGGWVVIEEANFMRDEVASVLYSIMDDRRELIIDEHEGEVIKAHPEFRLFLTMNWDYSGTQRFNPAIMNRVNSWFDVEYLPEDAEMDLLVQRTGIDNTLARKICSFASKIRKIAPEDGLPDISTRILLNWAEMVKAGLKPIDAAEVSIIPILGYSKDEKDTPRELLQSFFSPKKRDDDDD